MNLKQSLFMATMLGATLAVSAKPFGEQGGRALERIDTDNDGQVSFEEFQNQSQKRGPFARLDADGDGSVSQSELEAHQIEMQARYEEMKEKIRDHFDSADTNDDGFVSKDEAKTAAFNRIDQNNDGFLSSEELKQAHHQRPGFRHGKGRRDSDAGSEAG